MVVFTSTSTVLANLCILQVALTKTSHVSMVTLLFGRICSAACYPRRLLNFSSLLVGKRRSSGSLPEPVQCRPSLHQPFRINRTNGEEKKQAKMWPLTQKAGICQTPQKMALWCWMDSSMQIKVLMAPNNHWSPLPAVSSSCPPRL